MSEPVGNLLTTGFCHCESQDDARHCKLTCPYSPPRESKWSAALAILAWCALIVWALTTVIGESM